MMSRRIGWMICGLLLAGICQGCELGRTMFQMDSNSPTPQMSFDLIPQKKK
jgi:hypothetical protein